MVTERYEILFVGINPRFQKQDLGSIWNTAAHEEYKKSGIYTTATLVEKEFICGEMRGCNLGTKSYLFSSLRNPSENPDKEEYSRVVKNVIRRVKEALGNPYANMTIAETNFFYFVKS